MSKLLAILATWWGRSTTARAQAGQATAEYALVVLGAAAIGGLLLTWATGTGRITRLLNAVADAVIGQLA
jgi:uncharacterized integral membrane protein